MLKFLPLILLAAAFIVVFMVLKARKPENTAYWSAVGLTLTAAFLLFWVNGAVGIIGAAADDANMMYYGVLAVGFFGGIIERFQPQGMARTLYATALAHTLVGAIALISGLGSTGPIWPRDILILTGFFVALFVGSALLFQSAAREQPSGGVIQSKKII